MNLQTYYIIVVWQNHYSKLNPESTHRVQTYTTEYFSAPCKLVHNTGIRLITEILGNVVLSSRDVPDSNF